MSKTICINLGFVVPKKNHEEVENILKVHSDWMKVFYSDANNGSNYLLTAYFTKAVELKDPTNPSKGESGNILFTLNEKFTSIESLKRHNENVKKNDYFDKFNEIKKNYATFRSANGQVLNLIR
tara:strand:- start:406 stop:777 length:372 start_codon:yes stop_codon:yes gene_type:complete